MSVIPLTLGLGVALVGVFLGLFLREQMRSRRSSPERDALLPLAEEKPRVVPARMTGSNKSQITSNK